MRFRLTKHAKERMTERGISETLVVEAPSTPTKVGRDARNRLLFKKLYTKKGKARLLLLAAEWEGEILRIVTIIDTTKISKYI